MKPRSIALVCNLKDDEQPRATRLLSWLASQEEVGQILFIVDESQCTAANLDVDVVLFQVGSRQQAVVAAFDRTRQTDNVLASGPWCEHFRAIARRGLDNVPLSDAARLGRRLKGRAEAPWHLTVVPDALSQEAHLEALFVA
ncbi:MAG: hypothetical protein AB7S38_09070 [Vulcanimicrobiota bacterium]